MNKLTKQNGVTLLEVLVGFVIFTSSLVGILDYVSGQIYHFHLSSQNLQKTQLIYEQSSVAGTSIGKELVNSGEYYDLDLSQVSTTLEENRSGSDTLMLNRFDYTVTNTTNSFEWSVIRFN